MQINKRIEELREELIRSTQEIVKIKSVQEKPQAGMPFGAGVSKALTKVLEIADKLGFKTVNLDGYIGFAEYGEGEDYVGVLGHLDVVPEGGGWIYAPYEAVITDGKIFGRGTMDDKSPIIAALYGLKALKDLQIPLAKKVRIIFGTNEESGCEDIEYYLQREKEPVSGFTPDGHYPIIYAEKGITMFEVVKNLSNRNIGDIRIVYIKGGHRANMVPDYCEAGIFASVTDIVIKAAEEFVVETGLNLETGIKDNLIVLKSKGFAAHGSLPELGKNAIMQMFKFLGGLPIGESDIIDLLEFFNTYVGLETEGKSFGVALEDKESGKLSFNVGTISMTEDKFTMALNLRYPVTYEYGDMMTPFYERIKNTGLKVENMLHQKPLFFPTDHPLIKTLQKVYTDQTGQEAELLAIGGGTYAKEMPNIVAFGPIFPGEPDLDHQANEYIKIEHLLLNAKIYAHSIYELAK
ncbi:MAG: dipeptidase PepV [Desulfitobacteriaceae bacterium]|nr:dipeptidase PepV [Desulfitobacteriaceae bacterium]MDD4346494.1 dipeptidase PepV [Desulfitobacteriaceae bacterium]MDD4401847.1 dipeptidase PepV [Desulfitobacteriaceae bacterium]